MIDRDRWAIFRLLRTAVIIWPQIGRLWQFDEEDRNI